MRSRSAQIHTLMTCTNADEMSASRDCVTKLWATGMLS